MIGVNASSSRPYAAKHAKWVGLVHIIFGCIVLIMDLVRLLHGDEPSFAIFASVSWFLSGGFAIGGAINKTRCMILATMVRFKKLFWLIDSSCSSGP